MALLNNKYVPFTSSLLDDVMVLNFPSSAIFIFLCVLAAGADQKPWTKKY
jgi:hypothetical protein